VEKTGGFSNHPSPLEGSSMGSVLRAAWVAILRAFKFLLENGA